MGALSKNRIIKSITLQFEASTVEIQWSTQVREDGEVIGERFHRKAYTAAQAAELEADTSTGVRNKVANILNWV